MTFKEEWRGFCDLVRRQRRPARVQSTADGQVVATSKKGHLLNSLGQVLVGCSARRSQGSWPTVVTVLTVGMKCDDPTFQIDRDALSREALHAYQQALQRQWDRHMALLRKTSKPAVPSGLRPLGRRPS